MPVKVKANVSPEKGTKKFTIKGPINGSVPFCVFMDGCPRRQQESTFNSIDWFKVVKEHYERKKELGNWGKTPGGNATFQVADNIWISIPGMTTYEQLKYAITTNLG